MDITQAISLNLKAWMGSGGSKITLKKLSAASGVGFGTVQRAWNGTGNTTIQNLESIARAFGKHAGDLLIPPDVPYPVAPPLLTAREIAEPSSDVLSFHREKEHPAIKEAISLLRQMNETGKARALEHIRLVAADFSAPHQTNKIPSFQ